MSTTLSTRSRSAGEVSLDTVGEDTASVSQGLTAEESQRFSSQREGVGGVSALILRDDISFLSTYRRHATTTTDPSFRGVSYRRDANGMLIPSAPDSPWIKQDNQFFNQRETCLASMVKSSSMKEGKIDFNDEVGMVGGAWRGALRRLMLHQIDPISAYRVSRVLQLQMHLLSGHEAFILGNVVEALDHVKRKELDTVLKVAFKNRNVSRILVQTLGPRFDWLWHSSTQFENAKSFDAFGQVPIIGITSFPASENFPATRQHATNSILRIVLGEGNWITRLVTGNRQGLVTDNPDNTAQNLAAESNGFELANRNQFGTYYGRMKTNEFRLNHRLPTDEAVYRSFITSPASTLLNNGVVHVIMVIANHWVNLQAQKWGNFAHQRMEQLGPFEMLRFHMPVVLSTLANLRGRNNWDIKTLGPFIKRLQLLAPSSTVIAARNLVQELAENIVVEVCAGVAAVVDPFKTWLDAMDKALIRIETEAERVFEIVTAVEWGIRVGYDILSAVNWKVPEDKVLTMAILKYIKEEATGDINQFVIGRALSKMTPRDKRTMIELVNKGHLGSKPAQLLLGRAKTLLQREIRRDLLDEKIRQASVGEEIQADDLVPGEWYSIGNDVYSYIAGSSSGGRHKFLHIDSNTEKVFGSDTRFFVYVPVAESITRAQKAFMRIELDHGRIFAYNAFMEFQKLRNMLNRLVSVSQMACSELDDARINVLKEIQRAKKESSVPVSDLKDGQTYYVYDKVTDSYREFVFKIGMKIEGTVLKSPPQSVLVVGGGPTGLLNVIHSLENCLATGGVMKLYEARDAFFKGGATFERAQVVRLDGRWIAMMRYHLGTIFEDIYIPATGETNAQLGNTLPTQGFVEITIKNMEMMFHEEITRFWSNGLVSIYSESKSEYDPDTNRVFKKGSALKPGDLVLRKVDPEGKECDEEYTWFVKDVEYFPTIPVQNLVIGSEYGIWIRERREILPFKLTTVNLEANAYTFRSQTDGIDDRIVAAEQLPSIYPVGTPSKVHGSKTNIIFACQKPSRNGQNVKKTVMASSIAGQNFDLDLGSTHIVRATGKPAKSKVHLHITTDEPYGVCCLQGLKVSLGMHNFGERRWKSGILDDIRSQNDDNTRIIGDFTKMVQSAPIAERMLETIDPRKETNQANEWALHFEKLVEDSDFSNLNHHDPVVPKIRDACSELAAMAKSFRRRTLQTRFFETGDNYYLGMELPREYDEWKKKLGAELVKSLTDNQNLDQSKVNGLRGLLVAHIDRLWYEACLETIRQGDVYNPGARSRVPRLYLINSLIPVRLSTLPLYEAFRLANDEEARRHMLDPKELYEIIQQKGRKITIRSVEGYISTIDGSLQVLRESNLTRGPDGNEESKVAIATFDVHHGINYRTLRVTDSKKGYVAAFQGDEQSSPHFMRYSGLTGAGINAASFSDFIGKARADVPFIDRYREYSEETNWSNGEVVLRGTAGQFGEDGFLRPGAPYIELVKYLHAKIIEYTESGQDKDDLLTKDWKLKFAGALIPRGLEFSEEFLAALREKWHDAVMDFLISQYSLESSATEFSKAFSASLADAGSYEKAWRYLSSNILDDDVRCIAETLDNLCGQVISFTQQTVIDNTRYSSQLAHQPKSVDTISDDFAVEAQNFANSLTQAAAFAAGALAFQILGSSPASIISAILAAWNILIAFGSMTNVSRYKIRNEEARVEYRDKKLLVLQKQLYSALPSNVRTRYSNERNPYFQSLKLSIENTKKALAYYNIENVDIFEEATAALMSNFGDQVGIRNFQNILLQKFIPDEYSTNSYVQEYLTQVYRCTDEILRAEAIDAALGADESEIKNLFEHLEGFEERLEHSLQRGRVRWGFVKQRAFRQWDICAAIHYLYSFLFMHKVNSAPQGSVPIQVETLGLVKSMERISKRTKSFLHRETRDMEGLYWNTRESEIASMIFILATLVFIASILFTIARIFGLQGLLDFSFWASSLSAFGAFLGAIHFVRKGIILRSLWMLLSSTEVPLVDYEDLEVIKTATRRQLQLTIIRFVTAVLAMIALGTSVASRTFESTFGNTSAARIAAVAVCCAIGSVLYFFYVEYRIRYSLPVCLGPFVCELFRDKIEEIYKQMEVERNRLDPYEKQERENWEYTAREFLHRYRFDTVFAADRFGQILQYIQSGMKKRQSTFSSA